MIFYVKALDMVHPIQDIMVTLAHEKDLTSELHTLEDLEISMVTMETDEGPNIPVLGMAEITPTLEKAPEIMVLMVDNQEIQNLEETPI